MKSGLSGYNLEGWDREGKREIQEGGDMGTYVYVWLIHFVIKQKLTHHCRTIILQKRCLKKKKWYCQKKSVLHSGKVNTKPPISSQHFL